MTQKRISTQSATKPRITSKIILSLFCLTLLIASCSSDPTPTSSSDFLPMDKHPGAHIAFVTYLAETNEFAIELSLQSNKNWREWTKKGLSQCGKIMYEEEGEVRRYEISQALAEEWLDIRFLEEIHLYDPYNRDLGKATFVRYEFIDGNMSSEFMAIVKLNVSPKIVHYAIGGLGAELPKLPLDFTPRDSILDPARAFAHTAGMEEDATIQIGIGNHYFSAFQAAHPTAYTSIATVYETLENQTKAVMHGLEDQIILDLQPLPLSYNEKPVLLIASGIRNSGVFSNNIFVFNGQKYTHVRDWGKLQ